MAGSGLSERDNPEFRVQEEFSVQSSEKDGPSAASCDTKASAQAERPQAT